MLWVWRESAGDHVPACEHAWRQSGAYIRVFLISRCVRGRVRGCVHVRLCVCVCMRVWGRFACENATPQTCGYASPTALWECLRFAPRSREREAEVGRVKPFERTVIIHSSPRRVTLGGRGRGVVELLSDLSSGSIQCNPIQVQLKILRSKVIILCPLTFEESAIRILL